MNWRNLSVFECPLDGAKLHIGMLDDMYKCTREECDFKIGEKRLLEIAKDTGRKMSKREIATAEASYAALNNFGHRVPSQDYSDEIEKL